MPVEPLVGKPRFRLRGLRLGLAATMIGVGPSLPAATLTSPAAAQSHLRISSAAPLLEYRIGARRLVYNGRTLATGHSGRLAGLDNSAMESSKNLGPLPEGRYLVGWPRDNWLGKGAMPLTAVDGDRAYGRGDFWIHRQIYPEGTHGCIGLTQDDLTQVAAMRRNNQIRALIVTR
jgi:hypothetical protein